MKKSLFITLLAAEMISGILFLGLIFSNMGWIFGLITLLVTAWLVYSNAGKLKNALTDEEKKKIHKKILMAGAVPSVVGVVVGVYVIVSLILYFG